MTKSYTLKLFLIFGGFLVIAGSSQVGCRLGDNQESTILSNTATPSLVIDDGFPIDSPSATQEIELTPGGSSVNRQGLAISKSDVSGLQDSVLSAGDVIFIPWEYAIELGSIGGFDPSNIDSTRYAFFQLDATDLNRMVGMAATIGPDGYFAVDVQAGQYFVCLANIFVDHSPGPPYSVVGCDIIELPVDGSLTVSFGEGGSEAVID